MHRRTCYEQEKYHPKLKAKSPKHEIEKKKVNRDMKQVIARRTLNSENHQKLDQPSLELQLEGNTHTMVSREVSDKIHELSRRMMGEELQGLSVEEIMKLEKLLEAGLSRVVETKEERLLKEISTLQEKGTQLMEGNEQLRKQMEDRPEVETNVTGQGQSSESITNICSSANLPQDYDSSDISLKLGLPFLNWI
ncbi:hypothetical protein L1049_014944 [Liquidambar formosana]|uniref:K-box domain-containing protein n=1 Tax=Liquidambar formosana TaxID=63359 RepID=A0AAP0RWQ6_LIQFO